MTINNKEKKTLEIGYVNSNGESVYYGDKGARKKLATLESTLINIQESVEGVNLLAKDVKELEAKVNSITKTENDSVPKKLNTLTNELKHDQISMFTKDIYLYIDNQETPSKVNIIDLGKIHNKLTPLVKTIENEKQLSTIDEGEYIYLSADLTNK